MASFISKYWLRRRKEHQYWHYHTHLRRCIKRTAFLFLVSLRPFEGNFFHAHCQNLGPTWHLTVCTCGFSCSLRHMVTTRCRVTLIRTRVSQAVVSVSAWRLSSCQPGGCQCRGVADTFLFCHNGVVSVAVAVVGGDSGPSVAPGSSGALLSPSVALSAAAVLHPASNHTPSIALRHRPPAVCSNFLLFALQQQNSVSWQFWKSYGVTSYSSGGRKDAVNQYLQTGLQCGV